MMNTEEKIAMINDIMQAALQYKMHIEDGGKEGDFTDALLATITINAAALQKEIEPEVAPGDKSLKNRISEAYKVLVGTKKEKLTFEDPDKNEVEK